MYWFRLGSKDLIACRGPGWPLKKAGKQTNAEHNVFAAAREEAEALELTACAA